MSKSLILRSPIPADIQNKLDDQLNWLKSKERPDMAFDGPQWAYWAINDAHVPQFNNLIRVLKDLKSGKWDRKDFGLLADALAFGPANVTPFAFQWSFCWAPKHARILASKLACDDYTCAGLTKAVIATHPFPPSDHYQRMWVGFDGSMVSKQGAYTWLTKF